LLLLLLLLLLKSVEFDDDVTLLLSVAGLVMAQNYSITVSEIDLTIDSYLNAFLK